MGGPPKALLRSIQRSNLERIPIVPKPFKPLTPKQSGKGYHSLLRISGISSKSRMPVVEQLLQNKGKQASQKPKNETLSPHVLAVRLQGQNLRLGGLRG